MTRLPAAMLLLCFVCTACTSTHFPDRAESTATKTGTPPATAGAAPIPDPILFAYFTGNGEQGMKYALSTDGRDFFRAQGGKVWMKSPLGNGLVRDPSIVRGPDGVWHAVWTSGWWDKGFGLAHSADLITWSTPQHVMVMDHLPGAVNVWAPEIIWDPEQSEYLVMWASTVRGMFAATEGSSEPGPDGFGLNHRIWMATTKDFQTWSVPRVFLEPGFNVIDATIARDEPRGRWVMVFKDETLRPAPKKELRVAFADRMQGEYRVAASPIAEAGTWVEGPSVLEEGGSWTIYFDRYRDGRFGAVVTTDWEKFRVVDELSMPRGVRHGCMLQVPLETARALE